MEDEYKICDKCGAKLKVLEWRTILGKRFAIVENCTNCMEHDKEIEDNQTTMLINDLMKESNLQKKFSSITFESIKSTGFPSESYKDAFDSAFKYCSVIDKAIDKGWGMYVYGDTGRGKTTIIAAMINDIISKKHSCYINNITNLKDMIFNDKSIIYKLINVDVLFLDDFGTEVYVKGDETDTWTNEKVYEIINARYERQKPIIFTSNLSPGDLVQKGLLHKTADRISEMSNRKLKIETDKSLRL